MQSAEWNSNSALCILTSALFLLSPSPHQRSPGRSTFWIDCRGCDRGAGGSARSADAWRTCVCCDSITLTTGGNVCNAGVAMAKLGMQAAAAGLVGNDVLGPAVTDRLKQPGSIPPRSLRPDQAQTSATIVAVEPGGERCFFHTPGAYHPPRWRPRSGDAFRFSSNANGCRSAISDYCPD